MRSTRASRRGGVYGTAARVSRRYALTGSRAPTASACPCRCGSARDRTRRRSAGSSTASIRKAGSCCGKGIASGSSRPATSRGSPRRRPQDRKDVAMARGSDELVLLPLGGAGEIGMNLSLYGFGPPERRQWIVVDVGIGFPSDIPGVEIGMPDVRFVEEERGSVLGIVLTHGHEDHIGALFDLWPRLHGVPVHATPFTAALPEAKAAGEPGAPDLDLRTVPVGGRIALGPFDIEFVPVAHSIPESHALAIRTPLGLVFHTGDWKLDPDPVVGPPTDQARLEALGREGVRAVICDSTNALREGESPSEAEVARGLEELIV